MTDIPNANLIDPKLAEALQTVTYPGFDDDIMTLGMVTGARIEGDKAVVTLKAITAPADVREALENAIAAAVAKVKGVAELELKLPEPAQHHEADGPKAIEGVKAVVPVASGKGGVGKSTVAVNLAMGLKQLGLRVGLLDLDLYGPSVPTMLGLKGQMPGETQDGKLTPVVAQGVKVLSIGFMMDSERALIWRGPLIMKAVRQLLHDVTWAPLDVLVIDLPPGTGDTQISLAQEVPVTGAVVVTTPQDVALADAIKGVDLFRSVKAPVLGIVENMSYFICDDCGKRHEIFGHGSVEPLCQRLNVPYLGELPLDVRVRQGSDAGRPAVLEKGDAGKAYLELAGKVKDALKGAIG